VPSSRVHTTVASVVAGALGLLVGGAGSFVQHERVRGVPLGLLAALVATVLVVVLAGLLDRSRLPPLFAALGWLAAVLPLSGRRPEGDLVVAGDTPGFVWAYAGMALVLGTALVVATRARRR
jgi:drug/metabolite transporter (DMT)-like permease